MYPKAIGGFSDVVELLVSCPPILVIVDLDGNFPVYVKLYGSEVEMNETMSHYGGKIELDIANANYHLAVEIKDWLKSISKLKITVSDVVLIKVNDFIG